MVFVRHAILWYCVFVTIVGVRAQLSIDGMRQFMLSEGYNSLSLQFPDHVKCFYEQNQYTPVWMKTDGLQRRNAMFELLGSASDIGLSAKDYLPKQFAVLGSYISFLNNRYDSIRTEIVLTDAIIHFFHDVKNGNQKPAFRFDGLRYNPSDSGIIYWLTNGVRLNRLETVIERLEPDDEIYRKMKLKLIEWNRVFEDTGFREVVIESSLVDVSNNNLLIKLKQLGFLRPGDIVEKKLIIERIVEAQKFFDLLSDGNLGKYTLKALNVSLKTRISELSIGINCFRWVNEIKENGNVALLNIPSAQLFIYKEGSLIFDSKVITGKPSTPTATLTSSIKEVIVYPYWNVPYSIAAKELLPQIKRSIGYLGKNNYQVLNQKGAVLNPYTIKWHELSETNFPYQIRQLTGCDNALGILKFNFFNPFSIYLHDTPSKSLFFLNRRFFSHGCMRVEKPVELARLLLKDKVYSVETLINQCLENQEPVTVLLDNPLPFIVLYSTVWFDLKGQVKFFPDVYDRIN